MPSTVLATRAPSSAYHLLACCKPKEARLYLFYEARSHRIRGLIMRSIRSGDRGSPCRVALLITTEGLWPYGVTNSVPASLYMFETKRVKFWGRPESQAHGLIGHGL